MFHDDKYCRGHGVDSHNVPVPGDGQARHDVDVSDGYFSDEVAVLGEYLHSATLVASVTDHKLASGLHHSYFPDNQKVTFVIVILLTTSSCSPWIPQLPLLFPCNSKLVTISSILLKNLDSETGNRIKRQVGLKE